MAESDLGINFARELERFKPSMEIDAVGERAVREDLTDMTDIMMDLLKQAGSRKE